MKNTVVIYYSKGGTAQETALKIKNVNPTDIDVVDILKQPNASIAQYKNVYIGTGVYASNIPMEVLKFIKENSEELNKKKVYMYLHALGSEGKYLNIVKKGLGEDMKISEQCIFYLGGKAEVAKQNGFIRFMLGIIIRKKHLDAQCPNNIDEVQRNKLLMTVSKR